MLEYLKETRCKRITGTVESISNTTGFRCEISTEDGPTTIERDLLVNAAGPFADQIAQMLAVDRPIFNTFQQKIAFEDHHAAIPCTMPFSIDLDPQHVDWTEEERTLLRADPDHSWLAEKMPGAIHCRPDGGDNGAWVKLGWAYNDTPPHATWEQPLYPHFPDIVLRAAGALIADWIAEAPLPTYAQDRSQAR